MTQGMQAVPSRSTRQSAPSSLLPRNSAPILRSVRGHTSQSFPRWKQFFTVS
jgi:hypothetical protein